MKRHIQAVSFAAALAWAAGPTIVSAQDMYTLPSGTRLPLVLQTGVSSRASEVGDAVVAKTRLNVRDSRGRIVIPAGSEVHGRVTSADPGGKMKGRARLAVTFDRVVIRGEEHKMTAEQVVAELGAAGYALVERQDGLPWQHFLAFQPRAAIRGR